MVPRAVLTHLWLDDCFDDGKLVPVLYYHQPITIDLSLKPCEGAVIGISNYSGRERTYIRLVFKCDELASRTSKDLNSCPSPLTQNLDKQINSFQIQITFGYQPT